MKNKLLCTALILSCARADAAGFSAAVVIPADKPALAEEIAVGLDRAFTEKGHSLKVSYFDGRCDARKDKTLFGKVARAKPDFALGYSCGNLQLVEHKPAFPVFLLDGTVPENAEGLIKLTPEPKVLYDDFAAALGEFKNKRFLLLNDMTGGAEALLQKLRGALPENSFTEISVPPEKLNENINNLSQYADSDYDFIIVPSSDTANAVRLVSRIREAGLKQPVIGTGVLGTAAFSAKIGSMKHEIYFYAAQNPRYSLDAASVVADLRFDDKPAGDAAVSAYAAAQIFLKQKDGTNLRGKTFKTAIGTLEFDDDGAMKTVLPGQFFKWVNNQIKPVLELIEK